MTRQGAPTAAYVQQVVAPMQTKLATQVIKLLDLSAGQRIFRMAKIAARVHHLRVEPERIKAVGQIIMVGDRLGVGLTVMRAGCRLLLRGTGHQQLTQSVSDGHCLRQRPMDIQAFLDIRLAQCIQRRSLQLGE